MIVNIHNAKHVILLVLIIIITACDVIDPEIPEPTEAWIYTGPTIEPTTMVMIYPPTEVPPNYEAPGQSSSDAAAIPWDSALPPLVIKRDDRGVQTVQIPLRDGFTLSGQLYELLPGQQSMVDARLPGVLLIGTSIEAWGTFPVQLRDAGFTVLVMDMGDRLASDDLIDVLNSFITTETVNPSLIGVIGVDEGADQALIACALEALCDAVVLISPVGRDTLANIIADYSPRPLLAVASRDDPTSSQVVRALQQRTEGETLLYDGDAYGTGLLFAQDDLQLTIISWLQGVLAE